MTSLKKKTRYDDYEKSFSESEEEEDEVFDEQIDETEIIKPKKRKQGRRNEWSEASTDDLVDIILENDKSKQKLLLTNVKNVKNSNYYSQVIEELKSRCEERGEEFKFDIKQTRSKFKRCVSFCRDALMKVKTASGIKRFQEEKDLGAWFGRLLPVISSMDNCQPEQSIEPGTETETKSETPVRQILSSSSDNGNTPSDSTPTREVQNKRKRASYVPTPSAKRSKGIKPEAILEDIKEIVDSLKAQSTESSWIKI